MEVDQILRCVECGSELKAEQKFCGSCGTRVQLISDKEEKRNTNRLRYSIFFYFILFLICIVAQKAKSLQEYPAHLVIDGIFALITFVFVAINFRELIPLYSLKNVRPLLLVVFVIAIIPLAIANTYLITEMNKVLFNADFYYSSGFEGLEFKKMWMVLGIAIFPAVFEEVSFRGFLFNFLQPMASGKATIIVTAILFSFMHLSLLSFLWIFLFGLLLGYLRMKFNTLWYGMALHFTYNLTVTIYEWYSLEMF